MDITCIMDKSNQRLEECSSKDRRWEGCSECNKERCKEVCNKDWKQGGCNKNWRPEGCNRG